MNSGFRDPRFFHNFSEPDAAVLMGDHGFDHANDSLGGTHQTRSHETVLMFHIWN
jgi:phosphopentomutase